MPLFQPGVPTTLSVPRAGTHFGVSESLIVQGVFGEGAIGLSTPGTYSRTNEYGEWGFVVSLISADFWNVTITPPAGMPVGYYHLDFLSTFFDDSGSRGRYTLFAGEEPSCEGNLPPEAHFIYTQVNNIVNVSTFETTDPDGSDFLLTRAIDWGDGSEPTILTGSTVAAQHNYAEVGTYTITVTVTDPCGADDVVTDEVTITVIGAGDGDGVFPPYGNGDDDGGGQDDDEVEPNLGFSCPLPAFDEYSAPCGLDVTDEFKAHLAQSPTTLCVNWRVERRDGVVFGFTSHVRDLVFDSGRGEEVYKSALGLTPSGFANSELLIVDNMEVQAFFNDDAITDRDLLAGLFDDAEVEIFLLNYQDLTMGRLMGPRGHLGAVKRRENNFIAEVRALSQKLNQNILPTTSELCRVKMLGDHECKVDLDGTTVDGYKITAQGWVVSATDRARFLSNFSSSAAPPYAASELYTWDTVEFTSGRNDGETFSLVSFDGSKAVVFDGDEFNEVAPVRQGDEGILHATRISDSVEVEFDFEVADAVNNGMEISFHVKGSFWGETPPANEDTYPESHFRYGVVTFTSGLNHGISREVRTFGAEGFEVAEAFPFDIEANDHFEAIAGCDRRSETCFAKYNNIINIRSEYTIPGIEKALAISGGWRLNAQRIVDYGLSLLGVPWIHAGRNPAVGLDCEGLVLVAYSAVGWQPTNPVEVWDVSYGRRPDVAKMQRVLAGEGELVSNPDDLRPADVILFKPWHLALVTHRDEAGRVYFLHSNQKVGKVTQTHIDLPWKKAFISGYRFLGGDS